jgi:hypothetical protein
VNPDNSNLLCSIECALSEMLRFQKLEDALGQGLLLQWTQSERDRAEQLCKLLGFDLEDEDFNLTRTLLGVLEKVAQACTQPPRRSPESTRLCSVVIAESEGRAPVEDSHEQPEAFAQAPIPDCTGAAAGVVPQL